MIDTHVYHKPSFYTHIFTGVAILITLLLLYFYYKKINLSIYQKIIIFLLLTIIISIHGISHHYLEIYYHFNPLEYITK